MSDHRPVPVARGGKHFCKECDVRVIRVRPRGRGPIRKAHWKHMAWQQSAQHMALISPHWR